MNLFVGGKHDGARIRVDKEGFHWGVKLYIPKKSSTERYLADSSIKNETEEVETYRPFFICIGETDFVIFKEENLSNEQAFSALIDKYPQPTRKGDVIPMEGRNESNIGIR